MFELVVQVSYSAIDDTTCILLKSSVAGAAIAWVPQIGKLELLRGWERTFLPFNGMSLTTVILSIYLQDWPRNACLINKFAIASC